MNHRVLTFCGALAMLGLWLLLSWGSRRGDSDSDSAERRAFEDAWWHSFRSLTFAHNSTFTLLPDSVQRSAQSLLSKAPAFYDDISGQYHAQWSAEHIAQHTPFWNGSLPADCERPRDAAEGALEMTLDAGPAANGSARLVSGVARLRASGFAAALDVQGLFWPANGTAVLYGVPELSARTASDVVRAMPSAHAFGRARAAYEAALDGRLLSYTRPGDAAGGCSYQIFARLGAQTQMLVFAPGCSVRLHTPRVAGVTHAAYRRKFGRYFRAGLAAVLVQAALMLVQMRATLTHAAMSMVSHHTLTVLVVLDFYGFFLNSMGFMAFGGIYLLLGLVAVAAYMLAMALHLKYLIAVWKVQSPDALDALGSAGRRGLVRVYLKFYAAVIPGVYVIFVFADTRSRLSEWLLAALLAVMYSYWVPQIWLDVRRGVARSLRVEYIVGSTAARLFFPVYFLGCPENIAFLRPTPLVWVLAAYSLAQAAILVLQRVLGALFFIPPSLRPEVYNYCAALPSFDEESGALGQARTHGCPICLLPVGPAPSEMVHSASPPDSAHSTSLPAAHAVTPCRHVYHDACLAQWMEIKLECPICRTPLPPRVDC